MDRKFDFIVLLIMVCLNINNTLAQNPFILDNYTADPAARVFEGKVYVYPSHDIRCKDGQGYIGFCMKDYHVYSSENLTEWKDHGVILSQEKVKWVDPESYSMWAPDCIYKNGKYYFYFPAISNNKYEYSRRHVGVAISSKPYEPFKAEYSFIDGVYGIDPNVFIDRDGKAYIYWAAGSQIYAAKLKDNMLELATRPEVIKNLPSKFKEGPFVFERKGIYYCTYPYAANSTEQLVYAMGKKPTGPFEYKGVIMDESPTGCWTNQHSIIEYKKQWYLFYHHNDLSPDFDKNRSIKVDSLFFNNDGTIRKVVPTLRGVGISNPFKEIQIDRYSAISKNGLKVDYINNQNKKEGWKTIFSGKDAWIKYNKVGFSKRSPGKIGIRVKSTAGGTLQIRLNSNKGPLIANVKVKANNTWNTSLTKLKYIPNSVQDLVVVSVTSNKIEMDWIHFE